MNDEPQAVSSDSISHPTPAEPFPRIAPRGPNPAVSHGLLVLDNVHTYISGSHILQGISFDVTAGETTVLLGRNGAGKSTTLRTIMGTLPATSGSIRLDGREIRGKPAHFAARQGIALVPEDREVFISLTVEENLRLAQRAKTSRGQAGIHQAYTLFPDLQQARARSAGAISGGQQQMLAIARAMINHNRVLLIDEPTKGLAPVIVKQLQEIFRSLQEEGGTILLVEQNLEFAQTVGNRFFVLDEGRIVHGGVMDDLTRDSDLLRRYIGI
jgi:branched-chain amino acid transport system ATP-binding protein